MSASKAEKSRFWVAYFIDDLLVGDQFGHGLLHMTIIPWLVSDLDDVQVIRSFTEQFSGVAKFTIELGEQIVFGGKKRAPVTSIEPNKYLSDLHESALDWYGAIGGRWAVKNPHVGMEFHPHIRRRRGKKLPGGELIVSSLILVKAHRQEDGLREVAAKVSLA